MEQFVQYSRYDITSPVSMLAGHRLYVTCTKLNLCLWLTSMQLVWIHRQRSTLIHPDDCARVLVAVGCG